MRYEFCVIGGGIVGLATALSLLEQRPGASLVLVEKEEAVGRHQTGHNSGVIHSGIYYAPESFKARMCREGCDLVKDFCTRFGIPYQTTGKLIVATNALEEQRMVSLHERSIKNNIAVERLSGAELQRLEPNISGVGALLVPSTGIVDYKKICEAMCAQITGAGGEIRLGTAVEGITEVAGEVQVRLSTGDTIRADRLVACAGLQSDRLAQMAGLPIDVRIVPFKGEYYTLPASKSQIVKHLIYPVPDPELPFLGVHLTRMIDGTVTVGPNAVLGFAREGYGRGAFKLADAAETLTYPGFWKLARANWSSGLAEMKNSLLKRGYLKECRKYCPSLELEDLQSYSAGIRAQAVRKDGGLVHDFLFSETDRTMHVLNAPSPAATSSIPIGRMIAQRLLGARLAA